VEDVQVVAMLVRRCIAGDSTAWEEIVQTYSRRIYNICYRFAGSSDDAQDLTQEVFIKMYRTLPSYDHTKGAFVTWVTTITRNLLTRPRRIMRTRSRLVSKFLTNPRRPMPTYAAGRSGRLCMRLWAGFRPSFGKQ
jgi:RNA polymerase sigma-70 factor (ECF subfamily)